MSNALNGLNSLAKLIDIFGGTILLSTVKPDKSSYDPTTDKFAANEINEQTTLPFAALRRNIDTLPKTLIGDNRVSGYIPVTMAQIIKSVTTFTYQGIIYKIDYIDTINNGDSIACILISGKEN